MRNEDFLKNKQIAILELDDVLFPNKDYLLQVYYLFAQFIEYTEHQNAQEILAFAKTEFLQNGADGLFDEVAGKFKIDDKYRYNFELLHENARLPLKLLLFEKMLKLMQDLVVERKKIYIVTKGKPEQQLNKIKQVEWNGLEKYLTVFFSDELNQEKSETFQKILNTNGLTASEAFVVGANNSDKKQSEILNLPYISIENI
ncbi:haloacid dehalogenase [Pedobacter changchengzhani]|uniref:Haloacid dehalogenase n=1 Tax=Pedobacter changchengzhani TaxID=2529274 RepID=A0A4R5MLR1_9SPHI|nr:HAD hydrolase-like protein [Pedobacter changchengzhani]TDG36578.1 haloacid dehalogenase [Pedobacter changchengzhani]